jgi:DNA-binding response OmpR family regulator
MTSTEKEKTRVLIIDDEPDVLDVIVDILSDGNFELLPLSSPVNLIDQVEKFKPHVILTDKMMPVLSGNDVIKQIRENTKFSATPIFVVTALTDVDSKVDTFEIGADDYLTKPFTPGELRARVMALARRSRRNARATLTAADSPLQIDSASHHATLNNQELSLTLTEFKILETLQKKITQTITRDELIKQALGSQFVTGRTIDVHITALRKKLGAFGRNIITVRGVGYRLIK